MNPSSKTAKLDTVPFLLASIVLFICGRRCYLKKGTKTS